MKHHALQPLHPRGRERILRADQALEEVLAMPAPTPPTTEPREASTPPTREGLPNYILLPGRRVAWPDAHAYSYPDLLVPTQLTHLGLRWHDTQIALKQEGTFMLTLRQYVDFLLLLRSDDVVVDETGSPVLKSRVLEHVLSLKIPQGQTDVYSTEWLNGLFTETGGRWMLEEVQGASEINGRRGIIEYSFGEEGVPPQERLGLDDWLQLADETTGLPSTELRLSTMQDVTYQPPERGGTVIQFASGRKYANGRGGDQSYGYFLNCKASADTIDSSIGVRAARIKH